MDFLQQLLIWLPVLMISIVVHEVAHGWVALKQGDQTALMLGRITLNPLPHIDPVGSLLVPGLLAMTGAPVLGWAKPVPVNPRNYRNYKKGDILVSLAGVASNLILAVMFALLVPVMEWLYVLIPAGAEFFLIGRTMCITGVMINFLLIIFNLIPIPPLDGSHVFYYLLPPDLAVRYRAIGGYGIFIVFGLLWLGGLRFLSPVMWGLTTGLIGITRIFAP